MGNGGRFFVGWFVDCRYRALQFFVVFEIGIFVANFYIQ